MIDELLRSPTLQFVSVDRLESGMWEATYRGRDRNTCRQAIAATAVEALQAVLEDEMLV